MDLPVSAQIRSLTLSNSDATLSTNAVSTITGINSTWIGDPPSYTGDWLSPMGPHHYPGDYNTTVSPNSTTTISTREIEELLRGFDKNQVYGKTDSGRKRLGKTKNAGQGLQERLNNL